ncbi:hypothetical protein HPB49_025619 [Dermacentor silvarum]|uniref:Uncharacterized protein n=1 Tax=Dermacentor silvarum TaxID=543639 RepID=A0ACB8D118_DERSI|nr:hypothetical protein HPB49_025619 [Dermacentor silvarum]
MEQQNDALASPPSPTAAQQPETAGGPLGKAKSGTTVGQHSPLPPERRLERGPRSPAAGASPARSRKRSSRRRSPSKSARGSPSQASPFFSPKFNDARARQERKATPSPGRTRSRTATVGQSSGSPSSTEKMPRTPQPSPRPITTGFLIFKNVIFSISHSHKQTWPNTELIVGLLSCVLLTFLLAVGIVKIALSPSPSASKLCMTHACRAYSDRLLASINRSVDPCVHFTRFVCDGWQEHHNLDVWERRFQRFTNQLDATLKSIDIPAAGQNDEQRAAAVYRSCDDVFQGKSDELAAVKAALARAGIVWPQPSRGADALFALLYSSLKLGWDAVADFRVAPRSGETADELVVSQGRSFGLLSEWFALERATDVQRAYFDYIRNQFTGGSDTPIDTAVSYELMWEIAAPATDALVPFLGFSEVAPQPADWFANSSGANLTEARWIEALRRVDISLPDGLRISADNLHFLATLLDMWEFYGEDNFHLFVSWCTVQVAALYANRGLIINYYGEIPDRTTLYYRAFCVSRAVFFSQALIARYNGDVLQSSATVAAKEIVQSVRLAFSHRLSNWPYYNENITVVTNWRSLESAFRNIEYDNQGRTDGGMSDDMPDMTDSFVANWQHSVRLNKTRQVVRLAHAIRRLWLHLWSWGDKDFQLMPYTLSFPFFDPNLPTPINLGGFGSEVVAVLGSIVIGSYQAYSNATDYLVSCLRRGISGREEFPEASVNGVFGYRALVDAYRQAPPTTWNLGQLEQYTDLQLLFMSSCFVTCPGHGRGQQNECDMLALHVPEFAEAFKCRQRTIVNTSEHCQLL